MSNITSCDSGSFSTENTREDAAVKQKSEMLGQFHSPHSLTSTTTTNNSNGSNTNSQPPAPVKKKRSLPGNPDPSAEVIALSPNTLMATNRFICEICNKGFQRDQNLQLHRRGHNLPWKLKQRTSTEVRKRVYVCPEPSCVHHNPARALGDLTGIKKHFCRKHGEKKWKCDKCSKKYAVQSDWKAHSKICGTREYKCDCGTIFSRRDSFITHRAFCDALAEENNKANEGQLPKIGPNLQCQQIPNLVSSLPINTNVVPNPQIGGTSEFNHAEHKHPLSLPHELMPMPAPKPFNNTTTMAGTVFSRSLSSTSPPSLQLSSNIFEENGLHLAAGSPHMSATALLQKAAQMGATVTDKTFSTNMAPPSFGVLQQQPNGQSFMNQYMQSGQHDANVNISAQYNVFGANGISGGSVGMNGVDMFNAILDQSKALSKIIEQSNRSSSGGATNGGSSAINVGGSKGSGDVMTLDFLGIGGGGGGSGGAGAGGAHGNFYGGSQQAENGAPDEVWRNWSSKNAGFESFSATSSI